MCRQLQNRRKRFLTVLVLRLASVSIVFRLGKDSVDDEMLAFDFRGVQEWPRVRLCQDFF
jgi:hypothetical protein